MQVDVSIAHFFNGIAGRTATLDGAIVFFAQYFPYLVAVGFLYFAFKRGTHPLSFSPSKEWERIRLIVEGIGAGVVARIGVEVIRVFVHRPRPFVDNHAIVALLNETSYSFPSGHAAFFFALSTIVYLHNKRWGWMFFAASILNGVARVAAGVHYPTDILGGAILGILVGFAVQAICARRQRQVQ